MKHIHSFHCYFSLILSSGQCLLKICMFKVDWREQTEGNACVYSYKALPSVRFISETPCIESRSRTDQLHASERAGDCERTECFCKCHGFVSVRRCCLQLPRVTLYHLSVSRIESRYIVLQNITCEHNVYRLVRMCP